MGPRSENRGYRSCPTRRRNWSTGFNGSTVREPWLSLSLTASEFSGKWLQWVHGPRTVVMQEARRSCRQGMEGFNGSTVREPWLSMSMVPEVGRPGWQLQWVHGPRTVVIEVRTAERRRIVRGASMGPRSENRGYAWYCYRSRSRIKPGFNGSTVREPWLCCTATTNAEVRDCFNGSTVREPWLCHEIGGLTDCRANGFNGSTVREPWLSLVATVGSSARHRCFNGSTVREPWLSQMPPVVLHGDSALLQWVHGPRTVVMPHG